MNKLVTTSLYIVIMFVLGAMICREYGIKRERIGSAKATEACQDIKPPTPSDDTKVPTKTFDADINHF